MRASIAARINNSLLPRDATAGDLPVGICWWCRPGKGLFSWYSCGFADGAVWGRGILSLAFVWKCRKRLRGSAVRGGLFLAFMWHLPVVPSGKDLFSPAFLWHLPMVLNWKRLFSPGIFGIRHSAHSVPDRASCGTEYARGTGEGLLWYATHFQKHSVQKTGFWCTEGKFGAKKGLLRYATRFKDSYRRFRQKFVSCVTIEYGPYGRETEPPI